MNPVPSSQILDHLRWRYATKRFDPTRRIPDADWAALEEALILTPSSYGLQPWKFLVITRQDTKESLVAPAYNQRQVADCSHLLVFAVRREMTEADADRLIDFPFQKNIHQLSKREFIECLVDLYFREDRPASSFRDMLYAKFGRAIADKFLVPYNEKLYATDLDTLDPDAMGRFFPYADFAEVLANFRAADNRGYNATFTYPVAGAIEYVRALAQGVDAGRVQLDTPVLEVDLGAHVARTSRGRVRYERLVSTAPLPRLLQMCGLPHDPAVYSANTVEVFNLGFDRKGPDGVHWIYYPQRELCFYRVGFYDNILGADRMSLYVEIGRPGPAAVPHDASATLGEVLEGLRRAGVVEDHRLVSHHRVVLDPAYVHITTASNADVRTQRARLGAQDVYSIGRYGGWTYCSIEDGIVEARALVEQLGLR